MHTYKSAAYKAVAEEHENQRKRSPPRKRAGYTPKNTPIGLSSPNDARMFKPEEAEDILRQAGCPNVRRAELRKTAKATPPNSTGRSQCPTHAGQDRAFGPRAHPYGTHSGGGQRQYTAHGITAAEGLQEVYDPDWQPNSNPPSATMHDSPSRGGGSKGAGGGVGSPPPPPPAGVKPPAQSRPTAVPRVDGVVSNSPNRAASGPNSSGSAQARLRVSGVSAQARLHVGRGEQSSYGAPDLNLSENDKLVRENEQLKRQLEETIESMMMMAMKEDGEESVSELKQRLKAMSAERNHYASAYVPDIVVPEQGQPIYRTLTGHEIASDGRTLMEVEADLQHHVRANMALRADNKRLCERLGNSSKQIDGLHKENRKMQKDIDCILQGQSGMLAKTTTAASTMHYIDWVAMTELVRSSLLDGSGRQLAEHDERCEPELQRLRKQMELLSQPLSCRGEKEQKVMTAFCKLLSQIKVLWEEQQTQEEEAERQKTQEEDEERQKVEPVCSVDFRVTTQEEDRERQKRQQEEDEERQKRQQEEDEERQRKAEEEAELSRQQEEAERLLRDQQDAERQRQQQEETAEENSVDCVVGVRVKQPDGSSEMRKVKVHAGPKTKVSTIIKGANKTITKEGLELVVTQLVPVWTPAFDFFPLDEPMCSLLEHSSMINPEDEEEIAFDARHQDMIRFIGVVGAQFDEDFWYDHLDFLHEEFQWWDSAEFSDHD